MAVEHRMVIELLKASERRTFYDHRSVSDRRVAGVLPLLSLRSHPQVTLGKYIQARRTGSHA